VTGAGGFIGARIVERLVADGHEAVGIDVADSARPVVETRGGVFRAGDITDGDSMLAALDGCTHVAHTAAIVGDSGDMDAYVRVNVGGTRTVLDAADAVGVDRVLHLSSVAVWGYEFGSDLPEDAPPRPCGNPYIDTKGASELLALRRGATVVRPGDVYGPRSEPWILRPLRTMQARRFALPSPGDGVITPIYVDDLVDCCVRALFSPDSAGVAYTCHDGSPVPATEYFTYHARWAGRSIVLLPRAPMKAGAALAARIDRARGRTPDVTPDSLTFVSRRAAYPNARAREQLGWSPAVSLDEGMRRTEEWLRGEGLI
jgi:nucleoside-diphosphate-sugar epimerase